MHSFLKTLTHLQAGKSGRASSWDTSGRNDDRWLIPAGRSVVLADIKGPGAITHIWMTQNRNYRECLLKITWDDAKKPSVLCPLGDFFGLGHNIVNSYQSLLFTASTYENNRFNTGCALNCYAPMPFAKRAKIELVNESREPHLQYFYIDYETWPGAALPPDTGYFHAEFRRENPFGGWGPEIRVNTPDADIANKERLAWDNNYVLLETTGRGHYLGCNLSVTNFHGTWWGEGDDMIWVDGYKWPPDLHGTGSEDYLNQAWGMQPNAFLRNGTSIFEKHTGGYQTSYVHHIENPVRFQKSIKVTIEHGHGNHLCNEMSSVAYWYAEKPAAAKAVPPVAQRLPVERDSRGWRFDKANQTTSRQVPLNAEMRRMKARWKKAHRKK
ncbi:MAG: glycoside hydrolase family 172 protein [Planctomycetota bacterium]